ncbi:hypothetical protein BDF14DRAFT_1721943 [Spinellus fusiger]|nr:hypothetical protein BDF14DRAFT_1721943 [Spinellus fusiger]
MIEKVLEFQPFKDWVALYNQEHDKEPHTMDLSCIDIQSTDMFGTNKLGFLKFKANLSLNKTGKNVPGIVFMRGGAVAVLILLRPNDGSGKDKVVLALQPRTAVPSFAFPELPAGMLDGSGCFAGVAARELEEEPGLCLKEEELVDMTELAYEQQWRGVYPSAGGSDEFLRLFLCVKSMAPEDIGALQGRLGGVWEQGENITLKIVSLEDAWKHSPDAKLLSSLALYDALKREGKLDAVL